MSQPSIHDNRVVGYEVDGNACRIVLHTQGTHDAPGEFIDIVFEGVMAYFLVKVLQPLFILRPELVLPQTDIVGLAVLVLAVSVAASLAATTIIRRLPPGELLRDE